MRTLLMLLAVVALTTSRSVAQTDSEKLPKLAVKWSPLHLFYKYPSLQVALEYRVTKNVSLQYDAGVMLPYLPPYVDAEHYESLRGFRGMAEVRYYFPWAPRKVPMYMAGEFLHSNASVSVGRVIGHGCDTGDCDYFEYTTRPLKVTHMGGAAKFGLLLYPRPALNKSFFFDFNIGIGVHDIVSSQDDEFVESMSDNQALMSPGEKTRTEPRFVLGVRLCYRIL